MGNQESSRRVSFDNEEPSQVVNVSEKVVELINQTAHGEDNSQKKKISQVENSEICTSERKSSPPENEIEDEDISANLESLLEQELQKNNEYWEGRINDLQARHEKINEAWEREYEKAIKDVDALFGQVKPKEGKTPCSKEKTNVLNCYKKNSDQPLLCAAEVQAFSDCINGGKKE